VPPRVRRRRTCRRRRGRLCLPLASPPDRTLGRLGLWRKARTTGPRRCSGWALTVCDALG
jgi:hypothetical protein